MARLSRATGRQRKVICDTCARPITATESIITVALPKHEAMRRAMPYVSHHMSCWRASRRAD